MAGKIASALLAGLLLVGCAHADSSRKLLQTPATTVSLGSPSTITVSAANPLVNAITITLARPYPQNGFYCNVTGDSRIPQQGVFPLTVRVPVGVTSTVVFANITGPIPGTTCTGGAAGTSVVQQGATVVQQQGGATSIVQQQQTANSVVQQQGGSAVVQQQFATSVNQQMPNMPAMNCVANSSSVVQQQGPPSSVVQQQQTPNRPATVVQQQSPATVVQQQSPATVVQQQSPATVVQQQAPATPRATTPPTTVVQQPATPAPTARATTPPTTVVQQPATPAATTAATSAPTARATTPPTTVVQQQAPPVTVTQQQSPPATVVQQQSPPSSVVQQTGRHLLQVGTIEYISNNGSTGQPQLSVLDTVEGVPNISFKPTAAGQTATFNGGLQVAVTTTNDGFGTPFIPYRVDSRLSPQCGVQVNFVGI